MDPMLQEAAMGPGLPSRPPLPRAVEEAVASMDPFRVIDEECGSVSKSQEEKLREDDLMSLPTDAHCIFLPYYQKDFDIPAIEELEARLQEEKRCIRRMGTHKETVSYFTELAKSSRSLTQQRSRAVVATEISEAHPTDIEANNHSPTKTVDSTRKLQQKISLEEIFSPVVESEPVNPQIEPQVTIPCRDIAEMERPWLPTPVTQELPKRREGASGKRKLPPSILNPVVDDTNDPRYFPPSILIQQKGKEVEAEKGKKQAKAAHKTTNAEKAKESSFVTNEKRFISSSKQKSPATSSKGKKKVAFQETETAASGETAAPGAARSPSPNGENVNLTETLLNVIKSLSKNPDSSLGDVDILDIAKMKGIEFHRPSWWRPDGYSDSDGDHE